MPRFCDRIGTASAVAVAVLAASLAWTAQSRWLDTDGRPLPFTSDDALLEFLRTAEVIEEKNIGTGINRSVKLTLEQDRVRAHAIFREVDRRERTAVINRVQYQWFADSYLFECAAYELATLIGLPNVPPATLRTVRGRRGSLQIWIEDALDEDDAEFRPPSNLEWSQQFSDMKLFDNIIYNIDRNAGNIIVSRDYRLWMIDHTRAFQFKHSLLNDRILRVRRSVYEKLIALGEDEIRNALDPFLTPIELNSLLERRKALKRRVDAILEERGDESIFF